MPNAHEEKAAEERIESLAQSALANELLYGKDREEHIVAAHQISEDRKSVV